MATNDGLVSMIPTSVDHSGTSASINSDGGVDFTAVTSVSLNGVFTSDYDNYVIVFNFLSSAEGNGFAYRLRTGGIDDTGSNYTQQALGAYGSTITNFYSSGQNRASFYITGLKEAGCHLFLYGPYLSAKTAARSITSVTWQNASMYDYATAHSLTTSYDSITFLDTGGNSTGTVHVFGFEE